MSIFDRKPGADICDSCGMDRGELLEAAKLLKEEMDENMTLHARITELEGALKLAIAYFDLADESGTPWTQAAHEEMNLGCRAALSQEKK